MISDSREKTLTFLAVLRNPNWDNLTPAEQLGKIYFEKLNFPKRKGVPNETKTS